MDTEVSPALEKWEGGLSDDIAGHTSFTHLVMASSINFVNQSTFNGHLLLFTFV